MKIWRKGLVAMWKVRDMDCVFFETAIVSKNLSQHIMIEAVPLPKEVGDMAPIYFKKALSETGSEWSSYRKIIDLSKEGKGNVQNIVPKGFSYFRIDFGLQNGFVHVIDNEEKFSTSFAHEILCGMLDLDCKYWRKMNNLPLEKQIEKRDFLKREWFNGFDWTERAKASLQYNDDS
uniref:CwfJ_C_2 domain-containing protein n=1 Tax=Parastrongyloides trichosuri TaxID=131310 RepID=A0A0N4ZKC2_PARTI